VRVHKAPVAPRRGPRTAGATALSVSRTRPLDRSPSIIDLVEIGGRPCHLTGLVIAIHNPDHDDYTRVYTAMDLFVPPEIPAYERLHLDRNEWVSLENYVQPPRVSLANSLVLDVAARFRDRGEERVTAVTVGPSMPME
jgi:hypothetical protein